MSEKNNAMPQQIKKAREIAEKAKSAEATRKAVESGNVKTVEAGGMKTHYSFERVDGFKFVRAKPNLFINEDGSMKSESEIFDSLAH